MSSYRDKATKILNDSDGNIAAAAEAVYDGSRTLAIYVLQIGLNHIKAKSRAETRRSLRAVIQPQFRVKSGGVNGRCELTPATIKRMAKHTTELIEEWQIGNLVLGNLTREQLFEQANKEIASGKGHMRAAQFYNALAEPLVPNQKMRSYWSKESASELRDKIWKETERATPALV